MNENNANFTPAAPNFKTLVKMSFQGLTNFPYIEEDFDALTNYGLLSKVVEYLNEVISNNNEQNTLMTNLYNAYVSLQDYVNNYFDNLDVQDEINNKLDKMAQDGTLTQLIKNYVDPYIAQQNIRITNVENLVESLASGSPKGVYATTAALISANPETGVYIVTTDGHIYSWTHGGSTPVDLGVYQATGIDNNSITSSMLKNNIVTYSKIGDKNLTTIEDYYKLNNIFVVDTDKLIDSVVVNPTSQSTPETAGPNSYGWALPFKYDLDKQFKYLYIPYLRMVNDGYITVSIANTTLSGNITNISTYEITKSKYFINAGTYYDLVIALSDFDYSNLTDDTEYYFVIYSLIDETTITYNSLNTLFMKRKGSDNLGNFIDTTNNSVKYIANSSSWPFANLGDSYYNNYIPRFSLCLENPLTLDLVNFIRTSADVTNKLSGKIVNFMGDSITQGVGGNLSGSVVDNPYPKIISDNTSCTSNNYGIAGSTIGGDGSTVNPTSEAIMGYLPMVNRLSNMSSSADINVIFGGTNDALADRQVPLGVMGDTTNLTFYGALNNIALYLLNNYPTKINLFITPLKRQNQETGNKFGLTLKDYVDAIIEVANNYGFPVLDLYNEMGGTPLNSTWKNNNMSDGTHPNQNYYYNLAYKITNFINSQL